MHSDSGHSGGILCQYALFWSKVLQIRGVSLIFGPKKRPQDFSWGGFWGGLMDFGEASGGLKVPGEACLPRGGHL